MLISLRGLTLAIIGLCLNHSAFAFNEEGLAQRLEAKIKTSSLSKAHLGVVVSHSQDKTEKIIFKLNADKKFIPASLTKAITTAAVLDTLPKAYKFVTQLVSHKAPISTVLKGPLYLVGGGDPSFVSESFWFLVNELHRHKITQIDGGIVVDDYIFDEIRFSKGRVPKRVARAYDAPVGGMSCNWNSVNFYIRPGPSKGRSAIIYIDPKNEYVQVVNKTRTVRGRGQSIQIHRKALAKKDQFVVSGTVGVRANEKPYYASISRPTLWCGSLLKSFLQQRGIRVIGGVKRGRAPKSPVVLAKKESKPVDIILRDFMKFSNNYVGEMLTKNIAVFKYGGRGNINKGLKIIKEFMTDKVGVHSDLFTMTSPSGLSRRNKMSPIQFLKLFNFVEANMSIFPEFIGTLPIAGVDGTLEKRMTSSSAKNWVRAKTGMLNGVASLGGYAGRKDGKVIRFVFLYNGPHSKINQAKKLFDQWAEQLVL